MQLESALYVVATPIGNLGDMSRRAIEVLSGVSLIAAEDTRVSRNLLNILEIDTPLVSLHEHNEASRVPGLVSRIERGEALALISDAGTPLISDPGFELVRAARETGLPVIPVPGASAVTAALSVSGLPCNRFTFEGFLPAKAGAREKALRALGSEQRTMVFYESPRRALASLAEMEQAFGGDRQAVVARELTKKFETIYSGTLSELVGRLHAASVQLRGEFVILVAGAPDGHAHEDVAQVRRMLALLLPEMPVSRAAHVVASYTGRNKRDVYRIAQQMNQ